MIDEENIGQQNASASESETPENSAVRADRKPTAARPRIRRHISHGEKVTAYSATPYQREQTGYQPRTSNYQPRENSYQPRENGFRGPRYGSSLSQFAPREQRFNRNANGSEQTRGGEYSGREQSYNTTRYNDEGKDNYNRYQPQRNAYQRGAYRQRPYQSQPDAFNRVDFDYREGYNSNSYDSNYGNRIDNYNGNRHFGERQRNDRGGYTQKRQQQKRKRPYEYDLAGKYGLKKVLRYKEANVDPKQPIRLNKYLANAGICSRRDADKFITEGLVTVNGNVVTELGTKVMRSDEVRYKDQNVMLEDKIYILLNKPKDYVTTSDDPLNRKTVMDLVKNACPERIYPIGRLDRNTTGVLLLTNDGDMASRLMHPKYMKKKIYHVYLHKSVSEEDMKKILTGIELDDGEIKADAIEYASETDKKQVGIEIHSGRNRVVRRIFETLGYHVVKLDRVYFAGLTKKNLRRGEWRFLTEDEVRVLRMGAYE